ncbi:hypothetical protein [Chromatocurvus halotolerans]|uniref:Uncharacterized protein n=1 Tax=Chromatocurvus halotolerans TaxID=1132028 RepID=A0A4R2KZ47_9GAMM|nr:hypothetical protein [Chromatocurvus halotolerans]TCO75558.1 hypothetical protein EV688_108125 [Chromatocurvus halotolerans]
MTPDAIPDGLFGLLGAIQLCDSDGEWHDVSGETIAISNAAPAENPDVLFTVPELNIVSIKYRQRLARLSTLFHDLLNR